MNFKDLSDKEKKLVISYKFDLFRDKCIKLKEKGIDACVDDKDFDLKGVKITEDARDLIDLAVPQIINYKGLTFDRPLEGLGIGGFYYFMLIFFFERKRQLASRFEGYIIEYQITPISINSNDQANQNRLSIKVFVRFNNLIENDKSFEKNFSRFADFDSNLELSNIEEDLMDEIIIELINDIFNTAVVNW